MNPEEREDQSTAEAWLNEAILSLGDAGPRDGLEQRVVAGVRAYADGQRRRWTFIVAASAAAVLITAIVLTWPRSRSGSAPDVAHEKPNVEKNDSPASTSASSESQHRASRPHSQAPRHIEVQSSGVRRSPMPKPAFEKREATFPSPASPNDQGRLLQAFLRKTPPQDLALISARQPSLSSLESEDLSIAPLHIAELTPKTEAPKDQDPK